MSLKTGPIAVLGFTVKDSREVASIGLAWAGFWNACVHMMLTNDCHACCGVFGALHCGKQACQVLRQAEDKDGAPKWRMEVRRRWRS